MSRHCWGPWIGMTYIEIGEEVYVKLSRGCENRGARGVREWKEEKYSK